MHAPSHSLRRVQFFLLVLEFHSSDNSPSIDRKRPIMEDDITSTAFQADHDELIIDKSSSIRYRRIASHQDPPQGRTALHCICMQMIFS